MTIIDTLIKACYAGGDVMKAFFTDKKYKIDYKKADQSIVTEADRESEKAIVGIITNAFPNHDILSEEGGDIKSGFNTYQWIIDPIDGTANFANKNPLCCVSIAVLKEGEVLAGGVYNPFLNEFFTAEKGKGAFLNGKPIRIGGKTSIENSLFSISINRNPYNARFDEHARHKLFEHKMHIRRTGSSALDLCWTAMGRFDAFLLTHKLNSWDIAAGIIIAQEAGGLIKNINGKDFLISTDETIVVGNPRIVDSFFKNVIFA